MCDCRTTAKNMLLRTISGNSKYVLVVGDKGTGKTSLIYRMVTDKFQSLTSPAIPKDPKIDVTIEGQTHFVKVSEVPNESAYSQLRPLCYDKADVIVLCFAVNDSESLKSITEKWSPEIKKHKPSVPIILVATKCDLKSVETIRNPISYKNGQLIANEISAFRYIECSAKTSEGCLEALKVAVVATLS